MVWQQIQMALPPRGQACFVALKDEDSETWRYGSAVLNSKGELEVTETPSGEKFTIQHPETWFELRWATPRIAGFAPDCHAYDMALACCEMLDALEVLLAFEWGRTARFIFEQQAAPNLLVACSSEFYQLEELQRTYQLLSKLVDRPAGTRPSAVPNNMLLESSLQWPCVTEPIPMFGGSWQGSVIRLPDLAPEFDIYPKMPLGKKWVHALESGSEVEWPTEKYVYRDQAYHYQDPNSEDGNEASEESA